MLKNILRITLRNMKRQKGYAAINVLGLSLGLAGALLIGLFVRHELSFDRFHPNADRIYRVLTHTQQANRDERIALCPGPIRDEFPASHPEILSATQFTLVDDGFAMIDKKRYPLQVAKSDTNFLRIFNFPLEQGSRDNQLVNPNSMMIAHSAAERLFGTQDVLGKRMMIGDEEYSIAGVLADVPANSHLQFEAVLPIPKPPEDAEQWLSFSDQTYLQLAEGIDPADVVKAMNETMLERVSIRNPNGDMPFTLELQPMLDIHLHSNLRGDPANNGSIAYVTGFAVIAGIILLLACINFINLSTARSTQRAREVGLRKVMGAQRKALMMQFLGESIFYALIGVLLALLLVQLVLPLFNNLAQRRMTFDFFTDPITAAGVFGVLLLVGVLSGSFPAFILSAYRPTDVLKGSMRHGTRGVWMRQALVILQFMAAIGLIVGTLTIQRQLRYLLNKRLGFDKQQLVVLKLPFREEPGSWEALKAEVKGLPGVENASLSRGTPLGQNATRMVLRVYNDDGTPEEPWECWTMTVDPDFLDTWGIKLAEGRGFDPSIPTDWTNSIVINQAAVKSRGWVDNALDQRIPMPGRSGVIRRTKSGGVQIRHQSVDWNSVVGVLDDFNYSSLYHSIEPLVLYINTDYPEELAVRLAPGDAKTVLTALNNVWSEMAPGEPFEPVFVDDRVQATYRGEIRTATLISSFTGLAVVIAALGLFGLASFTAEARTKEIGIRKVMGSSVGGVVGLLAREFTRPVLIAAVLATPLAWWLLSRWLEHFAYRINLDWTLAVIAVAAALLLGWISVGFQAWRAARTDPVKVLRYE